jgi:hypothetical protein
MKRTNSGSGGRGRNTGSSFTCKDGDVGSVGALSAVTDLSGIEGAHLLFVIPITLPASFFPVQRSDGEGGSSTSPKKFATLSKRDQKAIRVAQKKANERLASQSVTEGAVVW